MKKIFSLLIVASLAGVGPKLFATTFAVDSLDGDITANELKQFTNSIKTITPPVNNYGDNMSTHGTEVEGMSRMYEATGDMNVLNRLIFVMDIALVHRNDQSLGEHRVMWDGTVAPGWPEGATNITPACSSGQIHGNIANCARLILETPSIWNLTVPDGNPYGYGVTYKQRATNYLAKVDQGLGQYTTVWFVDTNTFKIHTPSDSRWLPSSGHDTAETAWNRQALFVMAYQHAAECHDILGDNPSFLPLYKGVVNKFCSWFATAYPSGGSLYYTNNGIRVAKWYYQIPTDQHIENIGHAQHDMIGLYQGWESGYTSLTSSQMKVYADTTQFIINLGATNSWAGNVDGTGSSSYLKTDFIFLSRWNPALFKMIAQANINASQLNVDEGCKNTGYILWMKHWMFLNSVFSISAGPASQTIVPGSNTTFIVTLVTNSTLSGSVIFGVSGLPANTGATFNPTSMSTNGNSTLTITSTAGALPGSYSLTITGGNVASGTNSTSVVLNIVAAAQLFWTGGSATGDDWSDPANWNGQTLNPGTALTFNGVTRLNNTNNTSAGTLYSNIVFNSGAGAFVLNGNPVTLSGGITNNSAVSQTINLGLNFSNSITLNGAGSGLLIAGGLTNRLGAPGSTTVTLAGNGTLQNLFNSPANPGGTNVLALNNVSANWTLTDNESSAPMTVPWAFAVNNGTFNFGDEDDAPALTLTTPNNSPQDNQIGGVSGGTGIFNMVNGILTTSSRFNTATALNSTGIVNQVGGILNIGSQFQGANGGNAGEVSVVNLSGGALNISGGTGPFYVASRGNGTLNMSDDVLVNCGTLDVSRNASGNTFGSVGTVNLAGGILSVTRVGTATANAQTNGLLGSAATFNFNGGTLVAKTNAANFFQGSTVFPIIPINALIQAGGALIDDGGNTITIADPLKHDPALGSNPDGGLAKLGAGTLTLTATNTYTGDTIVSNGTLLVNGSLTNSAVIVMTGATLGGNGTLNGSVLVSPGGTISPTGVLTINNSLMLQGTAFMELNQSLATNDVIRGSTTITYGGTLAVTNLSGTLSTNDSFKLFSATAYSGAFAAITPTTPGAGLAWDTNSLVTSGRLKIAALIVPTPRLTTISLNGTTLTLTGTNGSAGGQYVLLSSTNVALPINQWIAILTNNFDGTGNFNCTNAVNPNMPQQFYKLRSP